MLLRTWAIIQKEFIQTLRDGRSLPIFQLILFAYAIRMNVEHIPMAVADQSLDAASHALTRAMETSGYFDVIDYVVNEAAVIRYR